MATAPVYNGQGAEVGTVELNPAVFEVQVNPALVHDVAMALMNARRQGNHETKTRNQVRGGGRRPYRQKGTGNARHGSIREPQMRGGGIVFGPHKRSYRQKVPVSFRRKAVCALLSDRLRCACLRVLDKVDIESPRTKVMAELVAKVAPGSGRTLLLTKDVNPSAVRSANNLPDVDVRTASDVNALDLLATRHVVVEQEAIAVLEQRLQKHRERAQV